MSVTRNAHQLPTEHLPAVVHAVEPAWKDVEIMTLDDVDSNNLPKGRPMRILVTIHSINSAYSNTIKNGLGLWVFYILKKYFRTRNIPVKLFMKSIVLGRNGWFQRWEKKTDVEDLIQFIDKNDIDVLIPSDVTDTQFVSRHYAELAPHVKCAVTSNVDVYERLEDKWETYTFCRQNNLPIPQTEMLHGKAAPVSFPFYLKISSGTNGGRGVWLIKNQGELDVALRLKECNEPGTILLAQKPVYGRIICAQVVYNHGRPVGFFFSESNKADNLASVGNKYIFSRRYEGVSHIKVDLEECQWEAVAKFFCRVGEMTMYHGMIDMEFIVADECNEDAEAGSLWLLEYNPRFSGAIHTTLSNPGFLDTYFDVLYDKVDKNAPIRNFSRGVEMQASYKDFNVLPFYLRYFHEIALLRNWSIGVGVDKLDNTDCQYHRIGLRKVKSSDSTECSVRSI